MSESNESGPPPLWVEMLDRVEQMLQTTHTELEKHEQDLAAWEGSPLPMQQRLEELQGILGGMTAILERAGTDAGEADTAMQVAEDAFRAWLAAGESVARKLADQASRPV